MSSASLGACSPAPMSTALRPAASRSVPADCSLIGTRVMARPSSMTRPVHGVVVAVDGAVVVLQQLDEMLVAVHVDDCVTVEPALG
jgi:hypothetical protein